MAILRNPRKDKYTVIDNYALRDENLSLKARGLLVSMLSMPNNWSFSENGLMTIFPKDGQTSIRSGLKELEQRGYLVRHRARDEHGRISKVEWILYDKPHLENHNLDNHNLDNRPQLNTNKLNTNKLNTEKESTGRGVSRTAYGEYGWVKLSDEEHARLISEYGETEVRRAITYIDEYAQSTGNKNKYKDWNLVLRKCIRDGWGKQAGVQTKRTVQTEDGGSIRLYD